MKAEYIFYLIPVIGAVAAYFILKGISDEKESAKKRIRSLINPADYQIFEGLKASVEHLNVSPVHGNNFRVSVWLSKDHFIVFPEKALISLRNPFPLAIASDPGDLSQKLRNDKVYRLTGFNLSSSDEVFIDFPPIHGLGYRRLQIRNLNSFQKKQLSVVKEWKKL